MAHKNIFDYIKEDNLEKVKELVENDETIVNSIASKKHMIQEECLHFKYHCVQVGIEKYQCFC